MAQYSKQYFVHKNWREFFFYDVRNTGGRLWYMTNNIICRYRHENCTLRITRCEQTQLVKFA